MAKDLTAKDVLYALEYDHQELTYHSPAKPGGKFSWTLEPSARKVLTSVAEAVRVARVSS